ncbi:TolC family protein [Sphingomonas sp. LT1P40]|uniref:TolC family protein n=1 Tax=Alteristakelama amylovorans TaxID=3096166 RepID=UPI002FC9B98F
MTLAATCALTASALRAQDRLPPPQGQPLSIDFAGDPVLGLSERFAPEIAFRDNVEAAVRRHPSIAEALAITDEARAGVDEAIWARLPRGEASISKYRVLAREFDNQLDNIVERSRPDTRTDAILSLNQTAIDWGAGAVRMTAAGARLRAASADAKASADRVALATVASWYDVFGFRALVALTQSFREGEQKLREALQERVKQGVAAETDIARIDSAIAQAETREAQFRRRLASAEARYRELTGAEAPDGLQRAPAAPRMIASRDAATAAAGQNPAVESANELAKAARKEASAVVRDQLPVIGVGIDAGRYGLLEDRRDYDVRASVTLRYQLFGGGPARVQQAAARSRAQQARADRVREEAERDAAIAYSDVEALEEQLAALTRSYMAARRSRDAIVERFRAARGTLFDVLAAEDAYFESATAYIQGLSELDAARYALLSRTGKLLPHLRIDTGLWENGR